MPTDNPGAPKRPGARPGTAKTAGGHAKILGVDWRIAGAGLVIAIVAGLYLRGKLGSASASTGTTAASAPVDTSGTGGASTSSDTSNEDLANALNGLTAVLSGGGTGTSVSSGTTGDLYGLPPDFASGGAPSPLSGAPAPAAGYQPPPGTSVFVNPTTGAKLIGQDAKGAAVAPGFVNVSQPIPVATENFAEAAASRSAALGAAGMGQPFGGVTSTVTNKKTGVTTTTYASGRVVTQAPGKSAYVSKKGG